MVAGKPNRGVPALPTARKLYPVSGRHSSTCQGVRAQPVRESELHLSGSQSSTCPCVTSGPVVEPAPRATPAPGTTSTGRRAARAPVIPGLIVTVAGHSIQTQSEIRETAVEAIIVKVTAESAVTA